MAARKKMWSGGGAIPLALRGAWQRREHGQTCMPRPICRTRHTQLRKPKTPKKTGDGSGEPWPGATPNPSGQREVMKRAIASALRPPCPALFHKGDMGAVEGERGVAS
jgi:hypothetical protein